MVGGRVDSLVSLLRCFSGCYPAGVWPYQNRCLFVNRDITLRCFDHDIKGIDNNWAALPEASIRCGRKVASALGGLLGDSTRPPELLALFWPAFPKPSSSTG